MIPIIGMGFGLADQIGDASHSRELDHLNEDARDAQHRREYLQKLQAAHCPPAPAPASPATPGSPPAQAG